MAVTHLLNRSSQPIRSERADVVIVGARVAGAATATHLARAGRDVVMLDRAQFPSDTISTHVIARSGMVQLGRLGVVEDLVASGAPQLRRVEFNSGLGLVSRTIKDRYGVDFVMAPRRCVLDAILQQTALDAGARLQAGTSVDGVLRDASGRVVGVKARDVLGPLEVYARHVVGADGLNSRIARSVGATPSLVRPSSGACQYSYFAGEWEAIEYHLSDGVFAGVFPTHGGEACIWAITTERLARGYRRGSHRSDGALVAMLSDHAPGLAERMSPGTQRAPVRGMLRMPNHFRKAFGPGWSLVGDAGYHRDAITGHGISDALIGAELLAEAIDTSLRLANPEDAALAAYELERDRLARPIFDLTVALAALPAQEAFVALQRSLATEIDELARTLESRPLTVGHQGISPNRKALTAPA